MIKDRQTFLMAVAMVVMSVGLVVQSVQIGRLQVELSNFKSFVGKYVKADIEADETTVQIFEMMAEKLEVR